MAQLFDLPDELLMAVTSHISKPSHMLSLSLVNKHSLAKILPLLYENLTFDHRDYDSPFTDSEAVSPWSSTESIDSTQLGVRFYGRRLDNDTMRSEPPDPGPPFTNIQILARMLKSSSLHYGQNITSLKLRFRTDNECNFSQIALLSLLPNLPSLKHLDLVARSGKAVRLQPMFSFAPLAGALRPITGSLKSLSIYVSNDNGALPLSDGWSIGSLRRFVALEYLSIQVQGLLGFCGNGRDVELVELLPSKLKSLQLCSVDATFFHPICVSLTKYLIRLQIPPRLENITLHVHTGVGRLLPNEHAIGIAGCNGVLEEAVGGGLERGLTLVQEQALKRHLDIDIKVLVVDRENH